MDSTRYDASYMRFNNFVSIVQVLGALCILGVLIYYSVHAVRSRGTKFYNFAIWFGFLLSVGAAGMSEYMVQRYGNWYLACYAVMSLCVYLMTLLVKLMYLRCSDRKAAAMK